MRRFPNKRDPTLDQSRGARSKGLFLRHSLLLHTLAVVVIGLIPTELSSQVRVPIIIAGPDVEGLHTHTYGTSIELVSDRQADEMVLAVSGFPQSDRQWPDLFRWHLEAPTSIADTTIEGYRDTWFGEAVARLTDMNGDGITEIAVGGFKNPPGETGAVWIASVKEYVPIPDNQLTLRPPWGLDSLAHFGKSVCSLTSLDGDSLMDLVVGAPGVDSLYVIYLDHDRKAKRYQPLPFDGLSPAGTDFGFSLTELGDIDSDGFPDIAVGAPRAGGIGAVYVAFLEYRDGRTIVRDWVEIGGSAGSYQLDLASGDDFGASVSLGPDLNRDGVQDLLVGAPLHDDQGLDRGAVWVLFLRKDGTVLYDQKLSHTANAVNGELGGSFRFGSALEWLGDFDRDGFDDIAVGVEGRGEIWFLYGMPYYPTESLWNIRQEPGMPKVGESVKVTGHWGISVIDATLSFRESGTETPFVHSMTAGSRTAETSGEIPASFVGTAGTEYAVKLRFSDGTELRSPPNGYHSVQVRVPEGLSLPVQGGTDVTSYRIISVPLFLDQPDARLILESTFGAPDPYEWRFYGLSNNAEQPVELGTQEFRFEPGRAFLLITRNEALLQTGAGTTVPTNPPLRVPVGPGWNLVGNPYNFEFPISHLRLDSGRPIDIRGFEGGWYVPDSLRILEGYALWSDTGDTLEFGTHPVSASSEAISLEPEWEIALMTGPDRDPRQITSTPTGLSLFPNPFRESVTIEYVVSEPAPTSLRVFDVRGRLVREIGNGRKGEAGRYTARWDGRTKSGVRAPPGLYHIRLRTSEEQLSGTVVLVQ